MRQHRWRTLGLVALLLLLAMGAAGFLGRVAAGVEDLNELRDVFQVIAIVRTQYVDPVDTTDLIKAYLEKGTINGMLSILGDDYTRYLDRHAFDQMQIETSGVYGGIGIYVGMRNERLTVIAPIEGTPAWKAGLQPGDWIVSIDGRSTAEMSQEEAVSLMRGEPGQPLTLEIQRPGSPNQEPRKVTMIRAVVEVPAVTKSVMLDDKVGYVRVAHFTERTMEQLDAVLDRLDRQGMQALILDLRNNPGGLLSAAIEVADRFIDQGPILHVVSRGGERRTVYAHPQGTRPPLPMVVLVNEGSASASEIVSGALKDRGLAELVGTTTFGKGLVQSILPLRGGAALSLTTARYLTAGGKSIHEKGIDPDVVVKLPELSEEEQLRRAEESLRGELDREDPQLRKALEVLHAALQPPAHRQAS